MKLIKIILFSLFTSLTIAAHADKPSVHGMVLFGEAPQLYASHLPMFHAPHDYQAIFKVSLTTSAQSPAIKAYTAAKAQGVDYFTIAPQVMDLTQVINGQIKEFSASLFAGHFEKGGTDLGDVTLTVEKVIVGNKLQSEKQTTFQQYIVFGEKGQYYAAHLIAGKPSFDAIAKVSLPIYTQFVSCRTRACSDNPIETPFSDSRLPMILKYFGENQKPALYDIIGSSPSTTIQKIIHFEADELSH